MASTEHATRDRERTRTAQMAAATQLISEQGPGVPLADIAAAAGVSKGALTHHFASPSHLGQAVLADGSWADAA